jgi:hypothetical protein
MVGHHRLSAPRAELLRAGGKELADIRIVVLDLHAVPPWHETFRASGSWHESPSKKAAMKWLHHCLL